MSSISSFVSASPLDPILVEVPVAAIRVRMRDLLAAKDGQRVDRDIVFDAKLRGEAGTYVVRPGAEGAEDFYAFPPRRRSSK